MLPADQTLPPAEHRRVAGLIREALARKRMSRQALADRAGLSISTLEKALAQRRGFTVATLVRLEEALGVALRGEPVAVAEAAGIAPVELGSYARPAVAWIEGPYLTLRPHLRQPGVLEAYCTEIAWDDAACRLLFRESERPEPGMAQHGAVAVPHQSGHIYLVTNTQGQHRLITLCRPTPGGEMHGILATLRAGPGAQLVPAAVPIVLVALDRVAGAAFGPVPSGHPCHAAYRAILRRTLAEEFALFPGLVPEA